MPRFIFLGFFIQLLDGTIISTSLPHMAKDFGVAPVDLSAGITVYSVGNGCPDPRLGLDREAFRCAAGPADRLDWAVHAGLGLLRARAVTEIFVATRLLQGAAAALMALVDRMSALGHASKSQSMNAIAMITWPALFAPVLGVVLGAWITEAAGWEWNFLIIPLV